MKSLSSLITNSVKKFSKQNFYTTYVPYTSESRIKRKLPLIEVKKNLWIASNASVILGDIKFSEHASRFLSRMIKKRFGRVDTIITPEAKAIGTAYFLAKRLGVKKVVVARKSVKSYMKNPIVVETKSITTKGEQILVIDEIERSFIKNKRVLTFDDVISTGGTLKSLKSLVRILHGKLVGTACVWLEGPWPWDVFEDEIKEGRLIWLSILPVFTLEDELFSYRDEVVKKYE